MNVLFITSIGITITKQDKEKHMKIRRQISASARRKHLKVQHSKINTRRQFFFNQVVSESNEPQNLKNNNSA